MKEPDRIVGELLQPGGIAALEKLGLKGKQIRINIYIYIKYHLFEK